MQRRKEAIAPLALSEGERKIYVLLTRYDDNGAKAISFFTHYHYTHASIGLDEDPNVFYSFGFRGFRIESITRYMVKNLDTYPCELYELSVPLAKYEKVKKILTEFEANKEAYRYARVGVVLGIMRIPFRFKRKYYCSQFVAEVLKRAEVIRLKKSPTLYMPCDFNRLNGLSLTYQGTLRGYAKRFAL